MLALRNSAIHHAPYPMTDQSQLCYNRLIGSCDCRGRGSVRREAPDQGPAERVRPGGRCGSTSPQHLSHYHGSVRFGPHPDPGPRREEPSPDH